jgi:hypothetical protein
VGSENNGHLSSRERESYPMREMPGSGRRQQQHPYPIFRETGFPRPTGTTSSGGARLSMNGLGVIQRLRNKSGSTSGEA